MTTKETLYQRLLAAGCELDHHATDLYVKRTDTSSEILYQYRKEGNPMVCTVFEATDGSGLWYDVAFAYDPAWRKEP